MSKYLRIKISVSIRRYKLQIIANYETTNFLPNGTVCPNIALYGDNNIIASAYAMPFLLIR